MNRLHSLCTVAVLCLLLSACSSSNGQPPVDSEPVAPSQVLEFATLYAENCAGCHGKEGRGGAAIALANPVYLAIADEHSVRKAIASGVRGTSMPAFAQSAGGMLTDQQVDAITAGIFSRWARKGILDASNPPSYTAKTPGSAANGQLVYAAYCASCHGLQGQGTAKGSSITNDSFLALVSDQGLRTVVVSGRPDLGAPDWRGNVPGRAMTDQEITDVVAWLGSRRSQTPGQPYAAANYPQR
ncbi:MAG TPA: cytochrome c [Candidatus Binatia bacterium]|nr:cytochrome c [Candidatus Binatia bacterium]